MHQKLLTYKKGKQNMSLDSLLDTRYTVFTDENDPIGEPYLVVVSRGLGLKFWTSFVPERSQYVERMRKGRLLWKPND